MTPHNITVFVVAIFTTLWLLKGLRMATERTGPINNQEFNVVLAIIANKVIGALYVIGTLITLAILLI